MVGSKCFHKPQLEGTREEKGAWEDTVWAGPRRMGVRVLDKRQRAVTSLSLRTPAVCPEREPGWRPHRLSGEHRGDVPGGQWHS